MRPPARIRIANEFASVIIEERWTGAGRRLELYAERTGQRVHIDATGLEALCWLTPEAISRLVTIVSEDAGPRSLVEGSPIRILQDSTQFFEKRPP